jgi:hypothetical protein
MVKKKIILTKEEQYILYSLGKSYQSFNNKFLNMPLAITISKSVFIDVMISSKSVSKKQRALYKNLESLEKKKYIKYDGKILSLTKKGFNKYKKIDLQINEYISLIKHLENTETIKLHKKLQTKFK